MLSDELRKRLAEMNRRPVAPDAPDTGLSPLRERLARAAKALEQHRVDIPARMTVEEAIDGREMRTASGSFYLVEPDPHTLHPDIRTIARRHRRLLPSTRDAAEALQPEFRTAIETDPARLLYLDIETTGFSGTPLFLIGLMYLDDDRIRISQLLARDYAEEGPLLAYLAEQFPRYDCLITFNGKTFDVPYIRDRYFAHTMRCRFPGRHLDLLGPSRRRWRAKLPDCRLQTLERWVCGRGRDGDIPGMDIPETYHLFVRTGNAALLRPILEHNALDLVTMGDVLCHLIEPPQDGP